MAWENDFGFRLESTRMSGVEIVHFEPQERAVSGRNVWIANGAVMIVPVPAVQLKNEAPLRNEPLIIRSTMGALAVEQMLIPAAAGLDIADANERLRAHF